MARRWHKNFEWTSGEKREFFNFYNKYGDKLTLGFPMDNNSYKKVYFEKGGEKEYISMAKAKGLLDAGLQKQVSMYLESVGEFEWALSGMGKPQGLTSTSHSSSRSKGKGFCISCGKSKSYNVNYPLCNSCFKSFDDPYDEYFDHCHKCGEVKRKGRLSIDGYTLCSACWKEEN